MENNYTVADLRPLVEEYESRAADLYRLYTRIFIDTTKSGYEGEEVEIRERAQAKFLAIQGLLAVPNAAERSLNFALYDSVKDPWYHELEYDSVVEMLSGMFERFFSDEMKEGGGAYYDLQFVVEKLIPALVRMDVPEDIVAGLL